MSWCSNGWSRAKKGASKKRLKSNSIPFNYAALEIATAVAAWQTRNYPPSLFLRSGEESGIRLLLGEAKEGEKGGLPPGIGGLGWRGTGPLGFFNFAAAKFGHSHGP